MAFLYGAVFCVGDDRNLRRWKPVVWGGGSDSEAGIAADPNVWAGLE